MARGKESRSLLDAINSDINNSSSGNFGDFFSIRELGGKCRVRFLDEIDDGVTIEFHTKYEAFNHPCLLQYGKDCPNCDNPEGKTVTFYYWNVYNYETKKVELFGYKANKASPIPGLVSVNDMLGEITGQDLVIQRNGLRATTTYAVMPTGKEAPLNKKVKKYTKKQILQMVFDTYKDYGEGYEAEEYEDDEDEKPVRRTSSKKPAAKPVKEPEHEEIDYEEMSLKELRTECRDRGIKIKREDTIDDLIDMLLEFDEDEDLPFN